MRGITSAQISKYSWTAFIGQIKMLQLLHPGIIAMILRRKVIKQRLETLEEPLATVQIVCNVAVVMGVLSTFGLTLVGNFQVPLDALTQAYCKASFVKFADAHV